MIVLSLILDRVVFPLKGGMQSVSLHGLIDLLDLLNEQVADVAQKGFA